MASAPPAPWPPGTASRSSLDSTSACHLESGQDPIGHDLSRHPDRTARDGRSRVPLASRVPSLPLPPVAAGPGGPDRGSGAGFLGKRTPAVRPLQGTLERLSCFIDGD